MKAGWIYIVAVVFFGGSTALQSRATHLQKQPEAQQVSQSSAQLILRRARASWPKFIREFRSALRRRDRNALFSLSSATLEKNCLDEDGRDIRKEFFADEGNLHLYLEIVTPGKHGHFVSKFGDMNYDKERQVVETSVEMNPCDWSLSFEYREQSGWLLVRHGLNCHGC